MAIILLTLSCSIENFCKNTTFFSIDQKIWHFLSKYHNTSKNTLGSQSERWMWRSHVSCPQADVSCTYGAFHAAKPRCYFMLSPRGRL
jgi:hypothetical protein